MDQNQNEPAISPKQQAVERVRQSNNVLVTVKTNPTVDELAAAIGLTLMLNKLGKHATAVFSGTVPSTLEFLKPEETIETNTDSLRDFIISLDKSKADKLRYKVEENVVKIFITPYRTSISQNDLDFSQGDFNVDVVMALGVTQREELDQAIVAHGRILHDATVVTVIAGQRESNLGAINWQEPVASSLSEMLVSISEAFQGGLIDAQIATAFLTGIVAETERFSNPKTTPKVMTMAAQLMAAGANQQLIANELQKAAEPEPMAPTQEVVESAELPEPVVETPKAEDGSLSINHENEKPAEEAQPSETVEAEPALEAESPEEPAVAEENKPKEDDEAPLASIAEELAKQPEDAQESPSFGSILPPPPSPNPDADSSDIHIDEEGNIMPINQTIGTKRKVIEPLEHPEEQPSTDQTSQATVTPPTFAAMTPDMPSAPPLPPEATAEPPAPDTNDTLLEIEQSVHSQHLDQASSGDDTVADARNALANIYNQTPFDPARDPSRHDLNAQPLGANAATTPENTEPVLPPANEFPVPDQQPKEQDKDMPEAPPLPPPILPQ